MIKTVNEMSNCELSRWFALLKAIDVVDENCQVLNKSFDDVELKPIALKHYINSLANKIENDLNESDERDKKHVAENKVVNEMFNTFYQNCDVLQDSIS